VERRTRRRRWLVFSIGGLILIGAGVSIVGEAIIRKGAGAPWFLMGTAGLVVLNSGVSFVGQGVIERVRLTAGRASVSDGAAGSTAAN
jgi:hypothetical protein